MQKYRKIFKEDPRKKQIPTFVLAYGIGLCTPPVGTSLFIGCSIAKRPIEEMVKGFLPFYGAMVILLLLTFIPEITLCLPRFLGLL